MIASIFKVSPGRYLSGKFFEQMCVDYDSRSSSQVEIAFTCQVNAKDHQCLPLIVKDSIRRISDEHSLIVSASSPHWQSFTEPLRTKEFESITCRIDSIGCLPRILSSSPVTPEPGRTRLKSCGTWTRTLKDIRIEWEMRTLSSRGCHFEFLKSWFPGFVR